MSVAPIIIVIIIVVIILITCHRKYIIWYMYPDYICKSWMTGNPHYHYHYMGDSPWQIPPAGRPVPPRSVLAWLPPRSPPGRVGHVSPYGKQRKMVT